MAKGCGSKAVAYVVQRSCPVTGNCLFQENGSLKALTCNEDSSKRGTPRQGIETAPKTAQNLRHEQRRNLWRLPDG